ncbi:MAG: acyl-CoA dehydrogenase [Desulfobacterales bacterium RIFOXYA12_FULL_46_15]|nr:MAG: acyl-CoA dehydrogenase [Desulfobacterales bacterium RIFOXYA12_FULL_46_15]
MNILKYSEKHSAFREKFRAFVKKEILPNAEKWEQDHMVPKQAWKKMGQEGFLCPCVQPEYGGPGLDFLYTVIIIEEMARTRQTGLISYLHSDIIVPYIESFGSEWQKKKYLPGCVSGDIITAVGMTEPGAGSDLASISTIAVEEEGHVIINGSKTFISNGINCDLLIIAVKDPLIENPHKAISLYLVEDKTPGFKKGGKLEKMGMHSQDTAELFFTNCRIPVENLLGEKGVGFVMLMKKLQQERLTCSIMALNKAEYVLEWTIEYCKNTQVSGRPLSSSQSVQFAFAEMATEARMSRLFVENLIADHMEKKDIVIETSMAKYQTSDMANRFANRCLDIIGSYAMDEQCPLVRELRDLKVMPIFAGTNEIMKGIIAKSMKL